MIYRFRYLFISINFVLKLVATSSCKPLINFRIFALTDTSIMLCRREIVVCNSCKLPKCHFLVLQVCLLNIHQHWSSCLILILQSKLWQPDTHEQENLQATNVLYSKTRTVWFKRNLQTFRTYREWLQLNELPIQGQGKTNVDWNAMNNTDFYLLAISALVSHSQQNRITQFFFSNISRLDFNYLIDVYWSSGQAQSLQIEYYLSAVFFASLIFPRSSSSFLSLHNVSIDHEYTTVFSSPH